MQQKNLYVFYIHACKLVFSGTYWEGCVSSGDRQTEKHAELHGRLTSRHTPETASPTISSKASYSSTGAHSAWVGTTPRLLQNHWLTGRPRYGQTDTRTERLGICAASRAFVFSRWISLTENQWRCTLTETQSNQKSKDDGGLTCNSRARTYSYTVAAGLRLRTAWWRFRRVHVRECVSHDRGTHLIIFANYTCHSTEPLRWMESQANMGTSTGLWYKTQLVFTFSTNWLQNYPYA